MKPIILVPLVALALAGSSAGAYFWLTSGGSVEEAVVAKPAADTVETPTSTPAPQGALPQPQPTLEPADWTTYVDPEQGLSFPHPQGLTVSEEFFDLPEKKGNPPVRQRSVLFHDPDGVFVVGIAIVPNPTDLPLKEWVEAYTGLPSEPQFVTIAGQPGLLLPINAMGDRWPVVYFKHDGFVLSVGGNVYGSGGGAIPAGISEAGFQRVIDGISVAP